MSKITRNELLTMLLYGLDVAMRPTMSNMFNGDEYWRDYNRSHRGQLNSMQADGLIERSGQPGQSGWAIKLTEAGRLRAVGGRDPHAQWGREWDGEWNLLMFDLEVSAGKLRQKLFRWLCANHFGCLQQSVWITPDQVGGELDSLLGEFGESSENVLVLRSQITYGKKRRDQPEAIAAKAWHLERLHQRYTEYLEFAKQGPPKRATPSGARAWVRAERRAWFGAFAKDPLLPHAARPKSYLGEKAWAARNRLLKSAAPMVVALNPDNPDAKSRPPQ